MPKVNPGEVTYIHSVVLTGDYTKLERLDRAHDDDYSKAGCYLASGRNCVDGDFQLQYCKLKDYSGTMYHDDSDEWDIDNCYILAHRGLDDANCSFADAKTHSHDINFREVLDTIIEGPILLRSIGVGDWHVHGWVGRLEDIPRAARA